MVESVPVLLMEVEPVVAVERLGFFGERLPAFLGQGRGSEATNMAQRRIFVRMVSSLSSGRSGARRIMHWRVKPRLALERTCLRRGIGMREASISRMYCRE
jgi:hypothetical protein